MLLCTPLKTLVEGQYRRGYIKFSDCLMCYVRFKGGAKFHWFFYTRGSAVQRKMKDGSDRCSSSLTGNKSGQDVDVTNVGTCEPN